MIKIDIKKAKEGLKEGVSKAAEAAVKAKEKAEEGVQKAKSASDAAVQKGKEIVEESSLVDAVNKAGMTIQDQTRQVGQYATEKAQAAGQIATNVANAISENEIVQASYRKVSKVANVAIDTTSGVIRIVGDKTQEVLADEQTQKILSATTLAAQKTGKITVKSLKVMSGVQAVHDRKKSITNKAEADQLKADIEAANEAIRDDLNETLEVFGSYRLEALHNTVGVFLNYLGRMGQRSKVKEYDFLREIDIKQEELIEMKTVDMKASQAAKVLAVGGGFAAVGLIGTPAAVTAAVTAFATASTGTAISTLSGAAATNAVLAWLGGGAIAAGGGGIAAGAAVMTALTAGATAGLAVIAVGTLASAFYARKNTESEKYLAEIKEWAAETEQSWVALNAVKARVLELHHLTEELEARAKLLLVRMEPFVDSFDPQNQSQLETFQQTAIAIKSMSELAQTPILDEEGNISQAANLVIAKTEKVLNKNL
jgi:hypothetical protein